MRCLITYGGYKLTFAAGGKSYEKYVGELFGIGDARGALVMDAVAAALDLSDWQRGALYAALESYGLPVALGWELCDDPALRDASVFTRIMRRVDEEPTHSISLGVWLGQ